MKATLKGELWDFGHDSFQQKITLNVFGIFYSGYFFSQIFDGENDFQQKDHQKFIVLGF